MVHLYGVWEEAKRFIAHQTVNILCLIYDKTISFGGCNWNISYLDGVREEAKRFIAHQAVNRNLLDPEDDRAVRQVFQDDGTSTGIWLNGIGPPIGRLDDDLDALLDQFLNMLRGKWGSTFPYWLALPGNV